MMEFDNVKVFTDNIDHAALSQIHELRKLGVFPNPIRIMPDCHAGAGCVIGFTTQVADKVIPNIVGVDIGCGMLVARLPEDTFKRISLKDVDEAIKEEVPSGRDVATYSKQAYELVESTNCRDSLKDKDRLYSSLGTLGGGNHFIEVDVDENGTHYLVIHTGSRNFGKQVADYYQDLADKNLNHNREERMDFICGLRAQGKQKMIEQALKEFDERAPKVPRQLAYLTSMYKEAYMDDLRICQRYAYLNREFIITRLIRKLEIFSCEYFHCIHNYIDADGMIRKGAISAKKGEKVIIPLNMRDGCILGVGKGNPDWNYSAPHGAGRIMSRSEAKKNISLEAFKESMEGIYTTTADESTIDEAPFAYKPSEEIISLVEDTVHIDKIIKPIYNYKAAE